MYGSRFAASRRVTVYRPGAVRRIAFHYGLTRRTRSGKEYKKPGTVKKLHSGGEPGLVDRVLALHAGNRGFDSHRGHMSERFFRSNRPGYPHPVSSELENSGIRVAVGDCSVTERRRWCPPYQTGKTVHVHAKHYKHNEDGRTAPDVCGNGSVPLSHSENIVTRIGIHTIHTEAPFESEQSTTKQKKIRLCHQRKDVQKFHFYSSNTS